MTGQFLNTPGQKDLLLKFLTPEPIQDGRILMPMVIVKITKERLMQKPLNMKPT